MSFTKEKSIIRISLAGAKPLKIPTSILGRGSRILKLATKVAFEEATSRLKGWEDEKEKLKSKIELYHEVVSKLSELKGASMKLGQLLGMDFGTVLPPEVARIFEELHQNGKNLPFPKILPLIEKELGEKALHFKNIHHSPLGAASIGQVHRAQLHGEEIVFKIQYPGVAEAIPSDLKLLSILLKKLPLLPGLKKINMDQILDEVKELLLAEADYNHELKMHQLYLEKFQGTSFRIPQIYPQYSTQKLLTLEYLPGLSFSEWLRTEPTEVDRQKIARNLIELYLSETLIHGLVQTDPNPGNFLVMEDGILGLLDFGAVKVYDRSFIDGYRSILLAAFDQDDEKVLKISEQLGLLDPREDKAVRDTYTQVINFLAAPFQDEECFDFSNKTFLEKSMELSWKLGTGLRFTPPPRQLLFLHRKLGGIFLLLRKMKVSLDLREYQNYVKASSVRR
jgi:predicted unusual protein kinase regulating ubiquinone biosynthesis (AarF/ABC1/UbiB family)